MKNAKIALTLFLGSFFLVACNGEETTDEENTENKEVEVEKEVIIEDEAEIKDIPTPEAKGYQIGDEAANFNLEDVTGEMISFESFPEARGFIIIFTCNHCPYAKAYEDRIIDLDTKYKGLGYPVIAISPNDPEVMPEDGFEEMKARAKEKGFTFPYVLDEGQKLYPQYGATKTPHVFIVNKENDKNIVRYIGAIDNNYEDANDVTEYYVEDALEALIAGEKVATPTTVAIGCSIKSK